MHFRNIFFLACFLLEGRNVVLDLVDIILGNSLVLRFPLFLQNAVLAKLFNLNPDIKLFNLTQDIKLLKLTQI